MERTGINETTTKRVTYKLFLPTIIYGTIAFALAVFILICESVSTLEIFNNAILGSADYENMIPRVGALLVATAFVTLLTLIFCIQLYRRRDKAFFTLLAFCCVMSVVLLFLWGATFTSVYLWLSSLCLLGIGVAMINIKSVKELRIGAEKTVYYVSLALITVVFCAFYLIYCRSFDSEYVVIALFTLISFAILCYRFCVPIHSELYLRFDLDRVKEEINVSEIKKSPIVLNFIACILNFCFAETYSRGDLILYCVVFLAINIVYLVIGRKINDRINSYKCDMISQANRTTTYRPPVEEKWSINLAAEIRMCGNQKTEKGDLSGLFESFKAFCAANGVTVTDEDIRRFFAAMSTGRIIAAYSEDGDSVTKLVQLFASYFGGGYYSESEGPVWLQTCNMLFDSMMGGKAGSIAASETVKAVYAANAEREQVFFAEIKLDNFDHVDSYFSDFAFAYAGKESNEELFLGEAFRNDMIVKKRWIKMPENLFMVLNIKDRASLASVAKCLTDRVTFVSVGNISGETRVEQMRRNNVMKYSNFKLLEEEAADGYFIQEATWRKIDELTHEMKDRLGCMLDNKTVLSMERYSIVYLAMNGDEKSVLDDMFADVMLPHFALGSARLFLDKHKEILDCIDERFPIKNMGKTERISNAFARNKNFLAGKGEA